MADDYDLLMVEATLDNWRSLNINRLYDYDNIGVEIVDLDSETQRVFLDRLLFPLYDNGSFVLYVDEAYKFFPRTKSYQSTVLNRIIRGGRKRNILTVVVSQQIVDLDPTVLKQTHYLILFKLTHHRELEMIRNYIDPELVLSLPDYTALLIDLRNFAWSYIKADDLKEF